MEEPSFESERAHGAGATIRDAASRIASELVAPGFAVDAGTTTLLLNSLVSALASRRRIYLNAFQRSGEVLDHFGHRLQKREFNVHSLDPWSMIPTPKAQDVMLTLSGSLETEPVLVTLLHADREGLYRFVVTAQPAEVTRKQFQGVLPVHIPGVTSEGKAAAGAFADLLPLGTLFELRSFLYLEALVEVLGEVIEESGVTEATAPGRRDDTLNPALLDALRRVREATPRVPEIMRALVAQYVAGIGRTPDAALECFLGQLLACARDGRTIYVTGYGRNNEIGGMFAHRLANLGLPVAMTPTRLERPCERGDLLFGLSGTGATYEVLQRLSGARKNGLRTAVFTSVPGSPVSFHADSMVVIPAATESPRGQSFAEQRVAATPPPRPSESTFGLNSLLTLEAIVPVLMRALGRTEDDLKHTDPWQGFDPTGAERGSNCGG